MAQSKALEFLQKMALNIIFPGGEFVTNLIIAKVETLSHDEATISFSADGHGHLAPAPLDPSLGVFSVVFIKQAYFKQDS